MAEIMLLSPPDRTSATRAKLVLMGRSALKRTFVVPFVLLAAVTGCTASSSSSPSHAAAGPFAQPAQPNEICGHAILKSPFSYQGAAGKYSSGTAGLPTYGKPGADFPRATSGVILPAG